MHVRFNSLRRSRRRIIAIIALLALVTYGFLIPFKRSYADEITLFPKNCSGNWLTPEEAAGNPAEDTYQRGAQSKGVGETITCSDFSSEALPEGVTITSAHVLFRWALHQPAATPPLPSIEDSYDTVPAPAAEISPAKPDESPVESENIEPFPLPTEEEPISWFSHWSLDLGIAVAHAQEESLPAITPTPLLQEEIPSAPSPELSESLPEITEKTESTAPIVNEEAKENSEETPSSLMPAEDNPVSTPAAESVSENTQTGTPLFSIAATIFPNPAQTIGSVMQDQLEATYPLQITSATLPHLALSLTSLLTLDAREDLVLQGMQLVIAYEGSRVDDPIRQPDLQTDTILDDLRSEEVRVIRIKRSDNDEYEVWYRALSAEERSTSETELAPTDNNETSEAVSLDSQFAEVGLPSLTIPPVVTETVTPEVIPPLTESMSETVTPVIAPVTDTATSFTLPTNHDTSWNFVVGDEMLSKTASIALHDGLIFWLNKKGNSLYSFNILTQGLAARPYDPEQGDTYLPYQAPNSEERRALFDSTEQKFIFPK